MAYISSTFASQYMYQGCAVLPVKSKSPKGSIYAEGVLSMVMTSCLSLTDKAVLTHADAAQNHGGSASKMKPAVKFAFI